MTFLESILEDLDAGESPEMALHDLEGYLEPLTGPVPPTREELALWVNGTLSVWYLLRYIQLARYYPDGHKRTDLLHKAAGLMPNYQKPEPVTSLDLVV